MLVGVGIDAVEIERMRLAVTRTPKIIEKILSTSERENLPNNFSRDNLSENDRFISSLAARFVAKTATLNLLGISLFGIPLRQIEIESVPGTGAPKIFISTTDDAKSRFAHISFLCSMSHSKKEAVAVVIAQNVRENT